MLVQTMPMAIVNPCSTEYSELADTVLNYFESRFGDGSEGSFFNTDVIRGERRIRVGCRADIYIAAACDPRTKSLNCMSSQDKLNIFNELTKQVSAEIQKGRQGRSTQLGRQFRGTVSFSSYRKSNKRGYLYLLFYDYQYISFSWCRFCCSRFPNTIYADHRILSYTVSRSSIPYAYSKFSHKSTRLMEIECSTISKFKHYCGNTAAAMVFLHGSWQKLDLLDEKARRKSTVGQKRKLNSGD